MNILLPILSLNLFIKIELIMYDGMWKDRIYSFVHAAILYLCYRRDRNEQTITIERLLKTLSLEQLFNILKNEKETMHQYVYESIKGYLNMLPGFDKK